MGLIINERIEYTASAVFNTATLSKFLIYLFLPIYSLAWFVFNNNYADEEQYDMQCEYKQLTCSNRTNAWLLMKPTALKTGIFQSSLANFFFGMHMFRRDKLPIHVNEWLHAGQFVYCGKTVNDELFRIR